jgi:hypothetical protein
LREEPSGVSAIAEPTAPAIREQYRIWPLARLEAVRYARHPLFLVGLLLGVAASAGEHGPIELDYQVIPAFFIGVFGVVVADRLTKSTDRPRLVVDAAPASQTARTAASCWACAVPAIAGLALVVLHRAFVLADPIPDWMYGTYGPLDRFFITMVIPVIACVGGPLLGVAVGRWLRFPGASLLAVIVVLLWSEVAAYLPAQGMNAGSLFARILHMTTAYTAFGSGDDPLTRVRSYTGSPVWFAVWTLTLCGLAAIAALRRGAEGRARRIIGKTAVVLAVVAGLALILAIATGNQRPVDSSLQGLATVDAAPSGDHH